MNRATWISWIPFSLLILFSAIFIKIGWIWHDKQKAWSAVISEIETQKQRSLETRNVLMNNRWLEKKHKGKNPLYFEQQFSQMQFLQQEREAWESLYGSSLPTGMGGGNLRWERLQKQSPSLESYSLGRSDFLEDICLEIPSYIEMDVKDLTALLSMIEQSQEEGLPLLVQHFEIKRSKVEGAEVFFCKFKIIKRII